MTPEACLAKQSGERLTALLLWIPRVFLWGLPFYTFLIHLPVRVFRRPRALRARDQVNGPIYGP